MSTTLLDLVISVMSIGEEGACLPSPTHPGQTLVMPVYKRLLPKPGKELSKAIAESHVQTIRLQWLATDDGRGGWHIITPILLTALPSDQVYPRRRPF